MIKDSKRYTLNADSLSVPIYSITRLSTIHAKGLERLGIFTIKDLLYHFPFRYEDSRNVVPISYLKGGEAVTIYGVMDNIKVRRSFKGHIPMTEGYVIDLGGKIRVVWFNQAYIGKMYPTGTKVKLSGVIKEDSKGVFLSNPKIEKVSDIDINKSSGLFSTKEETNEEFLISVYKETEGVSSNYLSTVLKKIISEGMLNRLEDPIPKDILKKLNLPDLKSSFLYLHFPKEEKYIQIAKKRFAFEEIFYLKLKDEIERKEIKGLKSYKIDFSKKEVNEFIKSFPFKPTNSQLSAIDSIMSDLSSGEPMGRLLEGDVGSGKTFVAQVVSNIVINNKSDDGKRLQVAYMAPTEILAKQHFESFCKFFRGKSIAIGLLTSSGCEKFPSKSDISNSTKISKSQLSTWMKEGRIDIVIGTHSLIQKSVTFQNLALVIIDEQHRFGVKQRKQLVSKESGKVPHLLSMTATPIPRTLALTIFGDLDITVIDEMPKERVPIITELVPSSKRLEVYEKIREELKSGRQVYVICPRIDEQDEEEKQKRILKSVKEEAKNLAENIFPEFVVDILHSKMKKEEKEEVMQDFLDKKSDILVATSVIEVGINVPNATVIIIEHAERFGLAQLHQLRGRVGRREYQSYCYLFTDKKSDITDKRLKALVNAKNGFELAEQDMLQRGIGALLEGKQWGISDMAMEAIKNPKLVEIAKEEAKKIVTKELFKENKLLLETVKEKISAHME